MNGVIPYRGGFATMWQGYLYPFNNPDTAEEFFRDCKAGKWTEERLERFERYAQTR